METDRILLNTREYISILKELVDEGREAGVVVAGSSMSPFLADKRDYIYFKAPYAPLKKGDMVFYVRKSGQYVMHRICKITDEGVFLTGDGQIEIEGPVDKSQIFAVVFKVKRKNKLIGPGDFIWEFFEHIWINIIPLRPYIMKVYRMIRR